MKFTNIVSEMIWRRRYQKNNESLDGNLIRVATYCSKNEHEKVAFYEVMNKGLFFPAGRTMSNAGIGKKLTLNNCFVAPMIQDDMDDIFEKVKLGALTHKAGGGIGYCFSQLRPKGSPTTNDAVASGPVSFMDIFNAQTSVIMQGSRRGANMGVLSIYSMDIEDFITAKSKDPTRLNHFNISVMVDDDFMEAKNKGEDIWLHYPVYDQDGRILKDPSKWIYKKKINARYLWDLIVKEAYSTGEPGVFFETTMNKDNNLWYIENIVCTNPCAEYLAGTVYGVDPQTGRKLNPAEFGGACNLGSLFLHNFVENPFTSKAALNYDLLAETIKIAVRFLDNIIDVNNYPSSIYKNYQMAFRTIGLGVTGLADMLCMLGLKYNSQQAQRFVWDLMNFIALNAYRASIELAKEKGSFPFLDKEKFTQSGYLQKHAQISDDWKKVIDDIKAYGIRNAKLISIAPTGTLSLVFGNNCSSGIEPIFAKEMIRKIEFEGQVDTVKLRDYAYDLWLSMKNKDIGEDVFVTTADMSVNDHIDMLKNITFHVDMGVSKTINLPSDYPFESAKEVYDKCWQAGIKGCTIFRPNPVRQGILSTADEKKKESEVKRDEVKKDTVQLQRGTIIEVCDDVIGKKRKLMTGCGTLHCIAFFDPITGDLLETYFAKGSAGGCQSFMVGLSRLISLAARGGVDIHEIIDQLRSTPVCPSYAIRKTTKHDTSKGVCCPDAIANALEEMYQEVLYELGLTESEGKYGKNTSLNSDNEYISNYGEIAYAKTTGKCPQCKQDLENIEGCLTCRACGWTKCG